MENIAKSSLDPPRPPVGSLDHSSIIRQYWTLVYGKYEQFTICPIFSVGVIKFKISKIKL
jgi:hypothetical protein